MAEEGEAASEDMMMAMHRMAAMSTRVLLVSYTRKQVPQLANGHGAKRPCLSLLTRRQYRNLSPPSILNHTSVMLLLASIAVGEYDSPSDSHCLF